jgi:penicillin-binding protein 1A
MRTRRSTAAEYLRRKRWYRFFLAITILTLLISALGMGVVAGLFAAVTDVLPRDKTLSDLRPAVPTRILASDGTILARIFNPDQNREVVPLGEMGTLMADATIAIEDIRFKDHPGVDLRGIARAMVKNFIAGNSKEGASTITQQLARGLYLTRRKELTRKLQEIVIALELERRYAKDEILEAYLNQVFYGSNPYSLQSWGAQMAARNFFGKDAKDLTLAEAALLAGLPKNPEGYNPYEHPKEAKQRRDLVLRTMFHYRMIEPDQYDKAVNSAIKVIPPKQRPKLGDAHAPYFVEYIRTVEMQKLYGKRDAYNMMYLHGVDIYTSIDPRMQKVGEDAVKASVERNKGRKIDDGALIALDPRTGLIKAMVGGTSFDKDQYNIVTQGRRQPGSSFKPFVYTTALLRGYTPTTTVRDMRVNYPSGSGKPWSPRNSDGRYMGSMQLQRALWLSRNAAAVGIAADVGITNVIAVAHKMGVKSELVPVLPTAIGATAVSPMEICSGYGVLANHGVLNPPTGIVKITTPDGHDVLYEYTPRARRVIPAKIADTMKDIMRGVIERGTATRARCPFPASGKTGTTNSFRDAWFIGYTDDLVAAVWVGNRHNQPMNRTFGGTVPAPIWKEFMLVAHPIMAAEHKERADELTRMNNQPELTATDLDTSPSPHIVRTTGARAAREETPRTADETGDRFSVTICQDSDDRATPWCANTELRTYIKGRAPYPPSATCVMHTGPSDVPTADNHDTGAQDRRGGVLISICVETGKIATDKCPIVRLRRFTTNAPTETCPMHGTD